jgi:hypothetical protein
MLVILVILAVIWINREGGLRHIGAVVDHSQSGQSAPQP